jgi:hypothetical protein
MTFFSAFGIGLAMLSRGFLFGRGGALAPKLSRGFFGSGTTTGGSNLPKIVFKDFPILKGGGTPMWNFPQLTGKKTFT